MFEIIAISKKNIKGLVLNNYPTKTLANRFAKEYNLGMGKGEMILVRKA